MEDVMEYLWYGMEWNGRFQVWNGIVWEILPAMEDGRFTFHSIVCPASGKATFPKQLETTRGMIQNNRAMLKLKVHLVAMATKPLRVRARLKSD